MAEAFVRNFHNLEGDTIGERKKSLHKLLRAATLSADDLDSLAKALKPETHLESLLRVEVLTHFRRFADLLGLVLKQDVAAERILKSEWFIETLIEKVSPERVLEEVFPSTSLVIRLKIVNKIAECFDKQEYADKLFDLLENTYGIKLAAGLIPACSGDKLRTVFATFDLILPEKVQLMLAKRNPDLLFFYYKEHAKDKSLKVNSKQLLNYLVVNNFDIFWFVFENCEIDKRLGLRITRRIIEKKKDYLVSNARKVKERSVLNDRKLAKWFGDDFEAYYFNCFPKNFDELYGPSEYSKEMITARSLPKHARYELFKKTFEKIHKAPLADHPKYISEHLLELMGDKEERERCARAKLSVKKNDWFWIKFFPAEKAIPLLKQKVNLTSSPATRRDLLYAMVDSCKYDNDLKALLDVGNYVAQRHRNEESYVRNDFLRKVDDAFNIEKLDEPHSEYLEKLMACVKIDKENIWFAFDFLMKRLRRKLTLGKPADEIKSAFKDWYKGEFSYSVGYYLQDLFPDFNSQHLSLIMEVIDEIHDGDEIHDCNVQLLSGVTQWNSKKPRVIRWNLRKPGKKVPIPARLLDSFKFTVEKKGTENRVIFPNLIRHEPQDDSIYNLYWQNYDQHHDEGVNNWLLRHKPREIVRMMDVFAADKNLQHINESTVGLCRQYEHLELPQKITYRCLEVLNGEDNAFKEYAVRILSVLLSAEEYAKVIEPYFPVETKVDLTDDNLRELFVIQCAVASSLKNAYPPNVALKHAVRFCVGDYSKPAVKSLSSILPRIPQDEFESHLKALESGPISVHKNALAVYCRLFSKAEVLALLKQQSDTRLNLPIRRNLFWLALSYFKQNPYDEFWCLLQGCISKLDKDDGEAFDLAVRWQKIPPKYMHHYVPFVWDVVENKTAQEERKYKLLEKFDGNLIKLLPPAFCLGVVKKEFLGGDLEADHVRSVEHFAVNCLLHSNPDALPKLIEATLANMQKAAGDKKYRRHSDSFVKNLCLGELKTKSAALEAFAAPWKVPKTFKQRVFLQVTALCRDTAHEELPREIVKLCEAFVCEYGLAILEAFADALVCILYDCLKVLDVNQDKDEGECAREFIGGVYSASETATCKLLFLRLLSRKSCEFRRGFEGELAELAKGCDSVVKIYVEGLDASPDDSG